MIDNKQFKAIFEQYFDSIRLYIYYKIAEKEAANDMAQDVFMTIWEKRAFLKEDNIKTLLYKIASGYVVDYYRKCDVKVDFSIWLRYNSEAPLSPQQEAEYNEMMQRYSTALNEMTGFQREAFMMNREEQLTYTDIASRLNISIKAVEKRMKGALKIINKNLQAI